MDDQALRETCVRYATDVKNLFVMSQTKHNLIGAYANGSCEYVLKLTIGSHRSFEAIRAEVDWMDYLLRKGISVSNPVPSMSGQLVEKIDLDGTYVTAVSFVKAKGKSPTEDDLLHSDSLVQEMGRFMGRMHAVTKAYLPTRNSEQRPQWFEDADEVASIDLPDSETEVHRQYVELNQALAQLPVSTDSYGLVHMDFHYNNFFLDGGKITAFDFEACRYSWFANDIAVALFHAIPVDLTGQARISHARRFFTNFIKGYGEENYLDRVWFKTIPDFIRHREIGRYIKLWRACNGEIESLKGFNRDFMRNRKDYITREVPFVDISFNDL